MKVPMQGCLEKWVASVIFGDSAVGSMAGHISHKYGWCCSEEEAGNCKHVSQGRKSERVAHGVISHRCRPARVNAVEAGGYHSLLIASVPVVATITDNESGALERRQQNLMEDAYWCAARIQMSHVYCMLLQMQIQLSLLELIPGPLLQMFHLWRLATLLLANVRKILAHRVSRLALVVSTHAQKVSRRKSAHLSRWLLIVPLMPVVVDLLS